MIIEVNCNDDSIRVIDNGLDKSCKLKHAHNMIDILQVICQIASDNHDQYEHGYIGIELVKIDENTKTTVGEW